MYEYTIHNIRMRKTTEEIEKLPWSNFEKRLAELKEEERLRVIEQKKYYINI